MLATLGAILIALFIFLVKLDSVIYDARYGVYKYEAACFVALAALGWAGLRVFANPNDISRWLWLLGLMGLVVYLILQWARRHED